MGKLIPISMTQGGKPVALAICLTALVAAATGIWMTTLDPGRARVQHILYSQPEASIEVSMAQRGDALEEKERDKPMVQSRACTVGVAVLLRNENHALLEWIEHYLAEVCMFIKTV
jgi:hypothetical protein